MFSVGKCYAENYTDTYRVWYNHTMISIDDFKKVEMRVGEILSAEKVENTDKLLKLSVDFGEGSLVKAVEQTGDFLSADGSSAVVVAPRDIRQIISGIAAYYPDPSKLVGKKCVFVTNLEPRVIKGLESNGMIMALTSGDTLSLLEVDPKIPVGASVR